MELTNLEKYDKAFMDNFRVTKEELPELEYSNLGKWDSVGHMDLIADLEKAFGLHLDMKAVLDISNYEKGKTVLAKEGVDFSK